MSSQDSQQGGQKILIDEGIYSRPQTRVTTAYKLWRQDHATTSILEFLQDNCKQINYESKYISKWRCDDKDGAYIVKAMISKDRVDQS